MKKMLSVLLVTAMVSASLLGCSSSPGTKETQKTDGTPAAQTSASVSDTEEEKQTAAQTELVVAQSADAVTMDPQLQGNMPSMNILINLFDTLVMRDADGTIQPGLATEWELLDDTTWQFKIREGVKFHNGEDLTADDVQFSLMRLINPDTKSPITELKYLTDVEIVDDYTVKLKTSAPDPILPNKMVLFGGVIIPADYYRDNTPEFVAEHPVGTGPYKFVSWARDSQVVMEANETYWRGAPAYKKLTFKTIPNWSDMLAAVQVGEVDLIAGVNSDLAMVAKNDPSLDVMSTDWIRTFYVNIDTAAKPLDSKEVRQALNYAVDKEAIIETVLNGSARQVSTLIPRENFGYDETKQAYGYDPQKAKQLLAEAGYPDGFEITFDAVSTDLSVIQAICGYLEAVGIKINMNVVEPATQTANIAAKTAAPLYFIGNTGWTMDALSNFQSYLKRDRRYCRFDNQRLGELVDIEETNMDQEQRLDALKEAQDILLDEAYFIYLWQLDNIIVKAKDVEYTPNKIGVLSMYDARPAQ